MARADELFADLPETRETPDALFEDLPPAPETVGALEGTARGLGEFFAGAGKNLTLPVAGAAHLAERVAQDPAMRIGPAGVWLSLLAGGPATHMDVPVEHTPISDAIFRYATDPAREAEEYYMPQPGEEYTTGAQAGRIGAQVLGTLAEFFLAGAATRGPRAATRLAELAENAKPAALVGEHFSVDRAQQLAEQGVDPEAAVAAGAATFPINTAANLLPVSVPGNLLTRAATGAGINLAAGEAERRTAAAAAGRDIEGTPAEYLTEAGLGAGLAALFGARGARAPSRTELDDALREAADGAPEASGRPPALPAPDTTIYTDSQGQAGTRAQRETHTREQVDMGLTPDIIRAAMQRARQERATAQARSTEPGRPPADTPRQAPPQKAEAPQGADRASALFDDLPDVEDPDRFASARLDEDSAEIELTPAQREKVEPVYRQAYAPRDSVTGFHESRIQIPERAGRPVELVPDSDSNPSARVRTVRRAQDYAKDNPGRAFYIEADIANLGGLNAARGHSGANQVYKELARRVNEALQGTGGRVIPFRHGGDEFSFVVVGVDETSLDAAMRQASRFVRRYTEDEGLSNVPHTKAGRAPGVGVTIAHAPIEPDVSVDSILSRADRVVENSKGGGENVNRSETEAAGTRPETGGRPEEAETGPGAPERDRPAEREGLRQPGSDVRAGREEDRAVPQAGQEVTAYTPDNKPVRVRYRLVEADELIASHDAQGNPNSAFPAALQPRERARATSQAQIQSIARRLNPELLGENSLTSEGAPIIGPDSVVESGNGRVTALRQAYEIGTGDRYREWLIENAERFGLDPETIRKARRPVLVRERVSQMDERQRAEFARASNARSTMDLSPAEMAKAEAGHPLQYGDEYRSRGVAGGGQSVESLRAALREAIGRDRLDRLERAGLIQIHDTPAGLRGGSRSGPPDDVRGAFNGRRVALVAGNIPKGREMGVFLHEAGGHAGLRQMLGEERYTGLVRRFKELLEAGDKDVARAVARVPADTPSHMVDEERLAYLIEDVVNTPAAKRGEVFGAKVVSLVRQAINAIRAWFYASPFYKAAERAGVKMKLTPDDIVALARRAARYWTEQKARDLDAEGEFAPEKASRAEARSREEEPATVYDIIDRKTGEVVGGPYQGKNAKNRARARVDKLDNEYGGYRYRIQPRAAAESEWGAFSRAGDEPTRPDDLAPDPGPRESRSFKDWYRETYGEEASTKGVFKNRWDVLERGTKAVLGSDVLKSVGMELADTAPKAFKNMLRKYRTDIFKAGELTKRIAKAGQALTEQERRMVSDYMENMLKPGDVPPQHVVDTATAMQAALKVQADEAVKLDMLSPEARDRWEGRYLPRFYARHDLGDNALNKALRAQYKKIDGTHLKGRGIFQRVPVSQVGRYRELGWELRDVEQGQLEGMQPGDTVLMWRDYTPEERVNMGEIRDAIYRFARGYMTMQRDLALGRLFQGVAQSDFARDVKPAEGWVQVPDTTIEGTGGLKRFGALAGKWVPADVWHHLRAIKGPDNAVARAYLKGLSLWKEGKTAMNPVVHGNNIVSNWVMADLAGVSMHRVDKYVGALRDYRRKGPMYQEALDNGLLGTEFYGNEIADLMPSLDELKAGHDAAMGGVLTRVFKKLGGATGASKYREVMGRLYQAEDQFFKLLLYMDARERGKTPEEAVEWANRFVFDYSDIPEGVRKIKATVLPFFSYTYKATPALAYVAMHAPWRLAKWAAIFGGTNWAAYQALYGDESDEQEAFERAVLPDYMKGYTAIPGVPKAMRLPFNDAAGRAVYLDLSRRMPLGDLFDAQNQLGGLPLPAPLMPNNPVLGVLAGMIWNKDTFTGREIIEDTDTAWEAAQKRAGWLFRQLAPNTPLLPGSYSWDKVMNGIANAAGQPIDIGVDEYLGKDYYGRETGLAQAAADVLTGTKLRKVDPDLQYFYQINELVAQRRSVIGDMYSVARDQSISEAVRRERMESLREKIERVNEQIREIQELRQ